LFIKKKMQSDLNRKDELLKSCELDLSKLQQTEYLLKKKSDQLTEIQVSLIITNFKYNQTTQFVLFGFF
jgi:hypothetical protein